MWSMLKSFIHTSNHMTYLINCMIYLKNTCKISAKIFKSKTHKSFLFLCWFTGVTHSMVKAKGWEKETFEKTGAKTRTFQSKKISILFLFFNIKKKFLTIEYFKKKKKKFLSINFRGLSVSFSFSLCLSLCRLDGPQ